jgi:trypsin
MNILRSVIILVFALNIINIGKCEDINYRKQYAKSPKIIGGERVGDLENYKFYAELHYSGRFSCGGTVVSKDHVLTAKHCVKVGQTYALEVINNGKKYKVKGYWLAEDDDIALLRMHEEFDVKPIKLAEKKEPPYVGQRLEVAGKGTQDDWSLPDHLRRVEVPAISSILCSTFFGGLKIKDSEVCMYEPGKGSCFGDSGGPLWDPDEGVQYGVVSWGGRNCRRPSVFAKVAYNIESIKTVAGISSRPGPDPKPDPDPDPKPDPGDDDDCCCCCCCCCHHHGHGGHHKKKKKCHKHFDHNLLFWRK